ncbi:hypothetical protein BN7_5720 [Wickerhamomyces ciferrii]|uniref:Uncharacterized protein n=1 Tax=Wickerhamomyces ciferrii (strain ATCC 14091 / BCRC 22168 / CBS 111 / JCM 3599 / NBRC 0793 / NRRL Y-1031 F-60-10) TaxID=1206466 RepID=K0KVX6_WICCF|nr:uncharacterized protein BN7_5720 [Wickerhamomyces ciferrii]CCH46132.1 hypothetical protein BN7_5720 [Wickerhamomyces ciferrii]
MSHSMKEKFKKDYQLANYWYWLSIWKARSSVYPLKYEVSNYARERSKPKDKENFDTQHHGSELKANISKNERIFFKRGNIKKSPPQFLSPFDIFPMEIWMNIMDYGVSFELIKLNKAFLEQFAPILYTEINGLMVFSDLKKLKKNDDFFLKFGPERKGKMGIKGYDIYKRRLESQNYDYEMLNIDHIDWEFLFFDKKHHKCFSDHKLNYITKSSCFNKISINILQNETSIMKKFVTNTSWNLDIIFLGRNQVYQFMNSRSLSLIKSNESCKIDPNSFKRYHCFPGDILISQFNDASFGQPRVENRKSGKFFSSLTTTFPKFVYYNEFILINRLLQYVKSAERKNLNNVESSQYFHDLRPLLNDEEKRGFQDVELFDHDMAMCVAYCLFGALEPTSVHVKNRIFCHKEDIENLIQSFIEIGSQNNSSSSIMFCSASDLKSKPLPAFEEQERSVMTPNLVLLNKKVSDSNYFH